LNVTRCVDVRHRHAFKWNAGVSAM